MNAAAETIEKPRKKRKIWMKKGSYKYLLQILHHIRREISEIKRTQRYMISGLEHTFVFDESYIRIIACNDEVDQEILAALYTAGPPGKLPKDISQELEEYKLNPWTVTKRIRRMNKRLKRHIAKDVAEKRGKEWALTKFAMDCWQSSKEELEVL